MEFAFSVLTFIAFLIMVAIVVWIQLQLFLLEWFLEYIFCLIINFYCLFATMQGEPSFHLFGFIMCIGATAARALKSVLQGILLSSEG